MEILNDKADINVGVFTPGNVIEDTVGDQYIVIKTEKYDDFQGAVTYSGYGDTNIKSGETFLYDSLDDLKCKLMSSVRKTVQGKHVVDFDIKGE